ncbi:hypothetical protein GGR56DRAFT_693683 [Xylariaceae sp. FL0804]|nr:hypothetical protein GGR56DRAFT_693683 [Xylariaceae sp. FL0804]
MNHAKVRDTFARLTRTKREPRDEKYGPRVDRLGRTNSIAGSSSRELAAQAVFAEGRGALILHDGVEPGEEGTDIVLVHGLFGSRLGSWSKAGICWPRDFLGQDVPNARVIAWGWAGFLQAVDDNFAEAAAKLLTDVARVRAGTKRPIIFIAHGLGGLLVKEALVTAALSRSYGSQVELGNVYPRTVGCVFLGTPHIRTGERTLGECATTAAVISPQQPSLPLLRSLKDHSPLLENQHNNFLLISREIKVFCVRESIPSTIHAPPELAKAANGVELGKGTMQVIVPKDAAWYEDFNVTRDEIPVTHSDLIKFKSKEEPAYMQLISHITKITAGNMQAELEWREPRNQDILNTLYYDAMMEREARIDWAYGQTCDWVFDPKASPLPAFLRSKDPTLWISGRAGYGKSTLMKYIWNSKRLRQELQASWAQGYDLFITNYFVSEGGNRILNTFPGFIRSMLYQILSTRRDLIRVAFPSFFDGPWPPPVQFNAVENLSEGFNTLFSNPALKLKLFIMIDGIDEYRDRARRDHYEPYDLKVHYDKEAGDKSWGHSKWRADSNREIAGNVKALGNGETIKWLASSRELPVFEEAFKGLPRIKLQDHTEKAIAMYVAGRLEAEAPGLPDTRNLCKEVAHKSRGDILWSRLAVDMIIDGSLRTLRTTLDSLPPQLGGPEGLYMRMIENLRPVDQNDACRIFHLVLRAQQAPKLATLAFAEQGVTDPFTGELRVAQDSQRPFTMPTIQRLADQMQRRLEVCCAGLLVAEAGSGPDSLETGQRVVFAHRTAKEWVDRPDIWHRLPGIRPTDGVELDLSLLSGCVRHLQAFEVIRPPVLTWPNVRFRPDAWLLVANALRYAERVDGAVGDVARYAALLDELDRTNARAWRAALDSHRPLVEDPDWWDRKLPSLRRKHWSSFEPMETGKPPKRRDFLGLAVQASLARYVEARLNALPAAAAATTNGPAAPADDDDDEGYDDKGCYDDDDRGARARKAQELLVYAVSPRAEAGFSACAGLDGGGDYRDFHHDLPASRLVDLLLEAGADPRADVPAAPGGFPSSSSLDKLAAFSGNHSKSNGNGNSSGNKAGVWTKALRAGRHYFSRRSATMIHLRQTGAGRRLMNNRERWVAAVKALLLHGADPQAELQHVVSTDGSGMGGGSGGDGDDDGQQSVATVVAVDLIRETLEGEPEYALDLLELETLMGRRGSVGLAR